MKHRLIDAGLRTLAATQLHRVFAPLTRGRGAVLMFHHVRPPVPQAFAPNLGLEITPAFLDVVLRTAKEAGYRTVPLGEVLPRLAARSDERFVALTFDDGYRDNLVHALPVLERHEAPATIFVTTGFADRTARLWWIELEALVRATRDLPGTWDGRTPSWPSRSVADKDATFARIAETLMRRSSSEAARAIDALGADPAAGRRLVEALCLDWAGLATMAAHPLVTLGCHTLSHPCLAALDAETLAQELQNAKAILESRIGRPVTQLAYPYGSPTAAGPREFAAAAAAGFAIAVTTRPGVLHNAHTAHPTALPRVSVNGRWQTRPAFEVLLSGFPFALWNCGRRVVSA